MRRAADRLFRFQQLRKYLCDQTAFHPIERSDTKREQSLKIANNPNRVIDVPVQMNCVFMGRAGVLSFRFSHCLRYNYTAFRLDNQVQISLRAAHITRVLSTRSVHFCLALGRAKDWKRHSISTVC